MSILVHVVLIVCLGIATISSIQEPPELVITATNLEPVAMTENLQELELIPTEDLTLEQEDPDVFDPSMAPPDVELPPAESNPAEVATAETAPADVADPPHNAKGASAAAKTKPMASKKRTNGKVVQFAGTEAQGNRFAFIVDNSLSMTNGRMLATLAQLQQAIGQMTARQQFYVVLYSDTAYPMFFPDPATDFLPATKQNRKRLERWLKTIEINRGGDLESALEIVYSLEPDAIFLLGDGGGIGKKEQKLLTGFCPRRKCVINSIAVGSNESDIRYWASIAASNGGQFQFFPIAPGFVQMSKRVRFPVNRGGSLTWSKKHAAAAGLSR